MRVLHVIPGIAPRYGGPSRAVVDMARAVERAGVECVVATTDADGPDRLPVELGSVVSYRGVSAIFFRRDWSEAFKYSRDLARWLGENAGGFDVAHVHAIFSHSSLAAARACRRHSTPFVVRPLGSLAGWSLRQKPVRKRLLWHLGVGAMLRDAAAIHYTADAERREAEEGLGLARGVVIPLGIDVEAFDVAVAPDLFRRRCAGLDDAPFVLALGRLHPKKGLGLLIDAFSEATAANGLREWRLVIAGAGEAGYVAGLRQRVRERGEGARILFAGWLDEGAKAAALREAGLLALPSHQENFGLAAAEAMACGVPVLLSTEVNLAEEVEAARAGWVVPLDRERLTSTLAAVLRDGAERAARGRAGRDLARSRWSAAAMGTGLLELYERVCAEHRARGR